MNEQKKEEKFRVKEQRRGEKYRIKEYRSGKERREVRNKRAERRSTE